VGKIIDPTAPQNQPDRRSLADLWDDSEKSISPQDLKNLEFMKQQDPRAFAIARVNEIRRRLSQVMCKVVADPKLLPNTDLLDWMRDRAKEKRLKYEMIEDKFQPGIIHTFIWDPTVERMDLRPWMGPQNGPENRTYLGWVQKNTEPTKNLE
jgi:hypothetical protein